MMTVRAAIAAALLAGFYVVGAGVVGGLAALSIWAWTHGLGEWGQSLSVVAVVTTIGLTVPLWQIGRAGPPDLPGVPLGEEQAPELWALVRAVADAVGTRPPDEIRLDDQPNAGAAEPSGAIGVRGGRQYLILGVPLLRVVSVPELTAVVAHEMGHFAGGHTAFGSMVYRGGRNIIATLSRLSPRSAASTFLAGYASLYFLVAVGVMRRTELEADAAAARVAGVRATRRVLAGLTGFQVAWDETVTWYARQAQLRTITPDELFDEYARRNRSAHPADTERPITPRTRSRWDSHPPAAERIRLLGPGGSDADDPGPTGSGSTDDRPGIALIDDHAATWNALESGEFAVAVAAAATAAAERDAAELTSPGRRRDVGAILDRLAEPRHAAALADRYGDALVDRVTGAVAAALIRAGIAGWALSFTAPLTLSAADATPIELRPLVESACRNPDAVPPLRAALRDLRLPEAVIAAWATPGQREFDTGPLFRTLPGTEPSEPFQPVLPDELFLLAHRPDGRRAVAEDALRAGVAAAALADLRRRHRIDVQPDDAGAVRILDPTPVGDRFLDSVLTRIAAGESRPTYVWLDAIGSGAYATVVHRLGRRNLLVGRNEYELRLSPTGIEAARRLRATLAVAVADGEPDGGPPLLGALLWGMDAAGRVSGRSAIVPVFWMGRLAARDPLMRAIRVAIGRNVTLPDPPTPSGAN